MSVKSVGTELPVSLDRSYPFLSSKTDDLVDRVKGFASCLMIPFWKGEAYVHYCFLPFLPGEYGQSTTKLKEYAKRFFIGLAGIALMLPAVPLALAGNLLTGCARRYESENYRYLRGTFQGQVGEPTKFMHLNTCMFYGGLPYAFGGVRPADERFDELIKTIKEIDSDMVFLCEFNRTLSHSMYRALKENYTHFFLDIGLNAWGMENGLFMASRKPMVSPPRYLSFDIPLEGSQKYMQRGFFAVETEDKWYLYTHLHPGEENYDRGIRQKQLDCIQTFIDGKTGCKPCILLGDLNVDRFERSNHEYQNMIERGFTDYFKVQHPNRTTSSDHLEFHIKGLDQKAHSEVLDYILINGKSQRTKLDLNFYETLKEPPDLSLSDHTALIGKV